MSFITSDLQSRLRQLLGLRGGPLVDVIEAVQPVVVLAAWDQYRQPQLESGDQIPRRWLCDASPAAVVGEIGRCSVRTTSPTTLLLVQRITITVEGAVASSFLVGLGANTEFLHASSSVAGFADTRRGIADIGTGGLIEVGLDETAVLPTMPGSKLVRVAAGVSLELNGLEFVCVSGDNSPTPACCGVAALTTNLSFTVAFEGLAFSFGPGAR